MSRASSDVSYDADDTDEDPRDGGDDDAASDDSGMPVDPGDNLLPGFFRFVIASQALPVPEPQLEPGEVPDIRHLLDRLASRMAVQTIGRLDSLLLQVLIARVSMAEMQYQRHLQEALRVSLEEAQEKAQGAPPADEEDIRHLPLVAVAPEHIECSDKASCIICLEPLKVGHLVKQLPCSHIFCEDCIVQWLRRHRTCPLCREEVINVEPSPYSYRVCGFRQLEKGKCECRQAGAKPDVCIFPACSHVFGVDCVKAHVWKSEPTQSATHRSVPCPLCEKASPVSVNLLLLDLSRPKTKSRNPLHNREPTDWVGARGGEGGAGRSQSVDGGESSWAVESSPRGHRASSPAVVPPWLGSMRARQSSASSSSTVSRRGSEVGPALPSAPHQMEDPVEAIAAGLPDLSLRRPSSLLRIPLTYSAVVAARRGSGPGNPAGPQGPSAVSPGDAPEPPASASVATAASSSSSSMGGQRVVCGSRWSPN